MYLNELNSIKLRKILGATRACFSYRNKHKDGSGNFGLVVVFEREGLVDVGCGMKSQDRSVFEFHGDYMPDGRLYSLGFSECWRAGARHLEEFTFDDLMTYVKDYIQKSEAERIKNGSL